MIRCPECSAAEDEPCRTEVDHPSGFIGSDKQQSVDRMATEQRIVEMPTRLQAATLHDELMAMCDAGQEIDTIYLWLLRAYKSGVRRG